MKKLFIAASALGAGIAGIILYYQRKEKTGPKVIGAAKDTYRVMNDSFNKADKSTHHSM